MSSLDRTLESWDIIHDKLLMSRDQKEGVYSDICQCNGVLVTKKGARHHDDYDIITSSTDGNIHIWDVDYREPLETIRPDDIQGVCRMNTAAVSTKTGAYLAGAGDDRILRIWVLNVADRVLIARGHGHTGRVKFVRWSPDECMLTSASEQGQIVMWSFSDD